MEPLVAVLDGYDGLKITLPNGRPVSGKVLSLPRASYYRRQVSVEGSPAERQAIEEEIIATFPKEVQLEAELNQLTLAEFWEVFWCFFGRRVSAAPNGSGASVTIATMPITVSS